MPDSNGEYINAEYKGLSYYRELITEALPTYYTECISKEWTSPSTAIDDSVHPCFERSGFGMP